MLRRLAWLIVIVALTACGGGGDSEPTGDIQVSFTYSDLNGKVGTPVQHAPTVSGLPAGATATYTLRGELPAGLSMNPSNGVISGTPTARGMGAAGADLTVKGYEGTVTASVRYDIKPLSLYTWTSISTTGPELQKTHVVMLDSNLYAIGHTPAGAAQTWRSMDGGVSWVNMNVAPTTGFRRFAVAAVGNIAYLTGGSHNQTMANTNEVWRFDGTNWTQVTVTTPFTPRHSHAMLSVGSNLYVIGGVSAPDVVPSIYFPDDEPATGYLNDVWRSTDGGANWTRLTALAAFSPRFGHCALALNNKLYVIGGYDGIEPGTNTVFESADQGATWRATANLPTYATYANHAHSACVVHNNRIVSEFGVGYRANGSRGVSPRDQNSRLYSWTSATGWNEELPWYANGIVPAIYGHGLAVVGTSLVSIGGKTGVPYRTVWRSQPETP